MKQIRRVDWEGCPRYELFTDGASAGNPGPGGWAYVLVSEDGKRVVKSGCEWWGTANAMELLAVIRGLEAIKEPSRVHIVSDSRYVVNGIAKWVDLRSRGEVVFPPNANGDLWRDLYDLLERHEISVEHVNGHSGHIENEACDQLARDACRRAVSVR